MQTPSLSFLRSHVVRACALALCAVSMTHVSHAIEYEHPLADYPFTDISAHTEVGKAALELYNRKIMGGYPDHTARVDNYVNRAEFSKYTMNAINAPHAVYAQNFSDVRGDEWFSKYVARAVNQNVINGYPDNTFKPARHINRSEVGKMIAALNPNKQFPDHQYSDVPNNVWFERGANAIAYYGGGPSGSLYNPNENVTRKEVILILNNMLRVNEGKQAPAYSQNNTSNNQNTGTNTNTGNNNSSNIGGNQTIHTGALEMTLIPIAGDLIAEKEHIVYSVSFENKTQDGVEIEDVEFDVLGMTDSRPFECALSKNGHFITSTKNPNASSELVFDGIDEKIEASKTMKLDLFCTPDSSQVSQSARMSVKSVTATNLSHASPEPIVSLNPNVNNPKNDILSGSNTSTSHSSSGEVTMKINPISGTLALDSNKSVYTFNLDNSLTDPVEIERISLAFSGLTDKSAPECALRDSQNIFSTSIKNPNTSGILEFILHDTLGAGTDTDVAVVCEVSNVSANETFTVKLDDILVENISTGDTKNVIVQNKNAMSSISVSP